MHRIALIIMILLLPLRGWTADAMATGMATGQLTVLRAAQKKVMTVATETIATHAHKTGAAGHNHARNADVHALNYAEPPAEAPMAHDCAMRAMDATDSASSGVDCGTCSSCQACHTVALLPVAEKSVAIFNPAALPDAAAQKFASADAVLSQKPPIS